MPDTGKRAEMADGTCKDCGAEVFRKGPTGFPPGRCPGCQKIHRRDINRRGDLKRMAKDPNRGARRWREWVFQNPERVAEHRATDEYKAMQKATHDRWMVENPERQREHERAWRRRNPEAYAEMVRVRTQRRRARLAAADTRVVTAKDWDRLVRRFASRCAYCDGLGPLTQDHVVPLDRGGRHAIGNLLPACGPCNSSKHNKLLVEWRKRRP